MDELGNGFDDLIKAFTIFKKYSDTKWPTHCEHDILYVCVAPDKVSKEDKAELDRLGFDLNEEHDCFSSYRFGSV